MYLNSVVGLHQHTGLAIAEADDPKLRTIQGLLDALGR